MGQVLQRNPGKSGKERTAVNVAGKKKVVTTEMFLMAALSRRVASATVFASVAITFMSAFPRSPASAIRTDASASRIFSALSFCAIKLYTYKLSAITGPDTMAVLL